MADAKKDFGKVSHHTYFDPMVHSTVDDMCFVCLHELDLTPSLLRVPVVGTQKNGKKWKRCFRMVSPW